ncbi:vegetative cell wall protein gp1-like [Oncorhynchus kisutch]|uniref:vegetative cell wall protein gp1-like n=1 Tax=Oncorhynchus kisutch TaxID=8019 RepID=UPI0012DE3886|nr:vegetative cell wall protein gp1-like [Oncorhynchus kisutch]
MYLPCLRPVQSPSSPPPAELATPALLQLHTPPLSPTSPIPLPAPPSPLLTPPSPLPAPPSPLPTCLMPPHSVPLTLILSSRPRFTEASQSPLSSPCLVPPSSPPVQVSLSFPADADVPGTVTPDTSITEGLPGLDFERYLQPAVRCSLSPREPAVAEMLSPMVIDVEMESPLAPSEETPQEEVSTPTGTVCVLGYG